MTRLADRVAVVTGGGAGIGQALAVRLAQDGADVALLDLNAAEETASAIRQHDRRALALRCDVTSPEAVEEAAQAVREELGGCDILVNNAGIYPPVAFADLDFAGWRRIMGLNADGVFLCCKAFLADLKRSGAGRIVNVVSATFWQAVPEHVHYIASKGAVLGLTRGLATDLAADGITVNAIAPGLVQTPTTERLLSEEEYAGYVAMQPIARRQVPEDLAGAVAFLASDDASFMTGQTLCVDGGMVRL